MKKIVFIIVCLILISTVVYIEKNNKEEIQAKRESVVDMILDNTLSVKSNGLIELPDDLKKLSDGASCVLVDFQGKTGIYFYTFRGILDSSKGYVFITDKIDYTDYINTEKFSPYMDFTNIKQISENWFSVSTD